MLSEGMTAPEGATQIAKEQRLVGPLHAIEYDSANDGANQVAR